MEPFDYRDVRRVLMTAETGGEAWINAVELARALGHYALEVDLATMGAPLSGEQWNEIEALSGVRVFESDFKLEWMESPWEDVRQAGVWLLQLEAALHPDVIHINGYTHAALAWKAPVLCAGHSCVFSWWSSIRGTPPPPFWDEYRDNVRKGLQAAGMVTAPTRFMLDALEQHYGPIPRKRIVPPGRSLERFRPDEKQEYIFAVCRGWGEVRNLASLERISQDALWPVFISGDGIEDTRHASNLHQLGRLTLDELATWYSHASIFVHPSYYEPFGQCVLEAALAGCALVLADIPALRENWDGAAVFVNPHNSRGLSEAVNDLVLHPTDRRQLAIKARTRALRFLPGRTAAVYQRLYEDLLRRGFSRAAI